jgi:hypothetical protein
MKFLTRICVNRNGITILIKRSWFGIHWFWQCYPLFGVINCHRKCNTVHEYGFTFLGFNIYLYIDK